MKRRLTKPEYELLDDFRNQIKSLSEHQIVEIEDIDRLKVFANAGRDILPDEIGTLLESPMRSSEGRGRLIRRIQVILRAYDDLPDGLLAEANRETDELLPTFELDQADAERVFKLCADMRKIVFASNDFDEPHRIRLLNRIAAIERETKKPKGLYDVVLGGISDFGETLGKFGSDIKPLTERLEEVARITRRGSKQYEQLPEPEEQGKLPPPERSDEEE